MGEEEDAGEEEEEEAEEEDNVRGEAGSGKVPREASSSQFKGVRWHKSSGKWNARYGAERKHLGNYDTEEAAAQAYADYVGHSAVPVKLRGASSQFKGVSYVKRGAKWQVGAHTRPLLSPT